MAEFVIKLADERGRVQEQIQTASTAEELRARFTHAGYHVFSVRTRGSMAMGRRKVKLEPFLIFNQQFLTLIKAGLPILSSLEMLGKIQKNAQFAAQIDDVATLYEQIGSTLPPLTLFLLSFGKWMQHNILWLVIAAVIFGFFAYRFSLTDRGKDFIDAVRVKAPVFGKIWLKYQVALFARTLSTLLTGGLPLVPSLETAARSISSRSVSRAIRTSMGTVREGKSLADSLTKTGVFPDPAPEMITVGEQTGALPQMLNSVAEFFEEDVATALAAALALIEPIILVVMGVVVVFILISLYLPIFSLGQTTAM